MAISISVIIPTRNRANFLSTALSSLVAQNYLSDLFEVIVLDNGSSDETMKTCKSYKVSITNFSYYYDATPGLHVGRNLGLHLAKGDVLVYADDDIEAFPTWLEGIAEAFKDRDTVLVGGKNLPKYESDPPDWIRYNWEEDKNGNRILECLSILDLGEEVKEINPFYVFGCNFSIRKVVLLEAGGFHPDTMPQDLIKYRGDGESWISQYISNKGYKAIYHPCASVIHHVPTNRMTVEYFCRRAFNQGISDSYRDLRKGKLIASKDQIDWKDPLRKIKRSLFLNRDEKRQLKIKEAYREGYEYHQDQVKKDQKLKEWVLRENYLGENGRLPE